MNLEFLPDFITDNPFMNSYPGENITLFKTKKPTQLLKGHYRHLNYEFIMTETPVEGFVLNGTALNVRQGALFAINSNQKHGTDQLISDVSFTSIQFEKTFLETLALELYGLKKITFSNAPIHLNDSLKQLVHSYIEESTQRSKGYMLILSTLSVQIAINLFRSLLLTAPEDQIKTHDKQTIFNILAYFKEHYETEISLDHLSEQSDVSKFTLIRKFKEATGMTPHEYLIHMRIMKSIEYLRDSKNKIIDVAILCGFENHSHFSKCFKSKTGLSPTDYRKNYILK